MIFGIAFRAGMVALAAAAVGVWWLYQRLTQKGGEGVSSQPRDEFVLNPQRPETPQRSYSSFANKSRWILPSPPQTQGRTEELPESISGESISEDSDDPDKEFLTPDDPALPPERVTERPLGRFFLEELQLSDGTLQVRVSESGMSDSWAVLVPKEKAPLYYEKADQLITGCVSIPTGGRYCFEYLGGLDITEYKIYDSQGNAQDEGGRLGKATTYEAFLDDATVNSNMVEGGFRFIRR